ncbi:MAG: hypothetical protein Tsb0010_00410 [Parvularculaceae bacterium]
MTDKKPPFDKPEDQRRASEAPEHAAGEEDDRFGVNPLFPGKAADASRESAGAAGEDAGSRGAEEAENERIRLGGLDEIYAAINFSAEERIDGAPDDRVPDQGGSANPGAESETASDARTELQEPADANLEGDGAVERVAGISDIPVGPDREEAATIRSEKPSAETTKAVGPEPQIETGAAADLGDASQFGHGDRAEDNDEHWADGGEDKVSLGTWIDRPGSAQTPIIASRDSAPSEKIEPTADAAAERDAFEPDEDNRGKANRDDDEEALHEDPLQDVHAAPVARRDLPEFDKAEPSLEAPAERLRAEDKHSLGASRDGNEAEFDARKAPRSGFSVARFAMKSLQYGIGLALIVGMLGAAFGGYVILKFNRDLPDYSVLARYEPPITTRVHAGDGTLITEYARERRIFVPIYAIPDHVKNAFISAEDKTFYEHNGLDYGGIARAVLINARTALTGQGNLVGASTITQQVAKNFLLSSERTWSRKIKEQLISRRIEKAFTKDQILELYLNEIYLGNRSYGVAAAALNYFDKPLAELTLDEAAYLAALPKGPNNYHPLRQRSRAIARRNWVLDQMARNGHASAAEVAAAKRADLKATMISAGAQFAAAEYFAEEVRREILDLYGDEALYNGGLSVRTTVDMQLQQAALDALRDGLEAYDRRHGWRGPVARIEIDRNWQETLDDVPYYSDLNPWRLAAVLDVADDAAEIGLVDGVRGSIPLAELEWARPWLPGERLGDEVTEAGDVLAPGDVVYVEAIGVEPDGRTRYGLRQVPEVNGAIVAIDPHTGRVLAMVGGYSFEASQFNRAVQARRQPGSAFKPFVYAAALDNGYTPASLILDAPFVASSGLGQGFYKPENFSDTFYGESTLRLGIEKSRNVMTVRLAQDMGMEPIVDYALRFNIVDRMDPLLAMALGAGETTLMRLTSAYAMLVNGGKRIEPVLIDRVQDRNGKTIYRHDDRACAVCDAEEYVAQPIPELPDERPQVIDPRTAYQVTSMLEGVVQRGTGSAVREVGKPLAGKTGTTNDEVDAWFVGFSPDLAVGVFVGFDTPRPMGRSETGGRVAAPIFRDFMKAAIGGKPAVPFRVPPGIRLVRINAQTGLPAEPGDRQVILEAFKADDPIFAANGELIRRKKDDLGGLY